MAGTLTPTPYQTVLDGDGVAVSGAKITTTDTGTGVAAATYTSADLSVANTNPIVADSAGRYVAYLPAGANFTFAITTSSDAAIETQTNIQAVPGASVNLDVEGTVGEAVTAGQVVYLSSAAEATPLTAGLWYLTDADAAPTSTTPQSIGVAVSAIAINAAGTIRLAGLVTTAGAVLTGTTYYVSATAGALTSSAPALSRQVGVAMTTSSLLLAATTAVTAGLPNPITQDLLFVDDTYDIGKTGASRPRDVFASRNTVVGGTLDVSGISTFTADLVATGASMSFQDAEGVVLGTGSDATIKYDGTDLVIAPAAVGAGDVHVSGGSVEVDDSESFTLGTGKDATIIYDGTDLTISPSAVGSGDLVIAGASAEFADSEGVTLGTGKDSTLQYDGTNVSLDTQAVGSGLLIVTGSAAISGIEIDNTATDGDPTLAFTLSGTSLFTLGVDDGDSDKLKIGTTAIGTNTALTIDGSQNIGVGVTSPDGRLHVQTATAGSVTAGSGADDLVVENSTHVGMTFLSPSGNYQQTIAFGDVGDADSGRIVYDHNSDMLALWTSGVSWLTISSAGSVALPDAGLLDLSAILYDDTASQGLLLPQAASATPSSPSSGEGYLAWDASGNQLIAYTGSAWSPVGGSAFDSTTVDSTTWSDGANATNTWTFDVSGIDTSLLFGNDALTFGAGTVNVNAPASTHAALNLKAQTASYDATIKVTSGSANDLSILHLERSDTWTYFKIIHSGNNYGTVLDTGPLSGAFTNFSLSGVVKLAMPANNNFAFTSLLDVATGNEAALTVNYTTNKATSGNDTGLVVNQTDTASPGVSLLADLQVGGASKFSVSNGGIASVGGITYTGIKATSGSQSLADTATVAVTEATTDCTLLVFDNSTSGRMGLFTCSENSQSTSIGWSNALSPVRMSNTQGTATSLNAYYTGGNLTIENNLGSTLVVKWKLEKIT